MRFINDFRGIVSAPNADIVCQEKDGIDHVKILIVRDVKIGEEILTDYGDNYCKYFGIL